jgi:hypothetical protein
METLLPQQVRQFSMALALSVAVHMHLQNG